MSQMLSVYATRIIQTYYEQKRLIADYDDDADDDDDGKR